VAYYYFGYRLKERRFADDTVACLLKQILTGIRDTSLLSLNLFQYWKVNGRKNMTRPDFNHLRRTFVEFCQKLSIPAVVNDGLDECDATQRDDILLLISHLASRSIRILVTSRPHFGDIEAVLAPWDHIEIAAMPLDIKNYCAQKINVELERRPILNEILDAALKTQILATIATKSDGRYIVFRLFETQKENQYQ